jgi:hypothetical protein
MNAMRRHVLLTLLHKEAARHLANRGGLVLMALVVVAAALPACAGRGNLLAGLGGVECCYVDYWHDGPWVEHLRRSVPPELAGRVHFRPVGSVAAAGETIYYPAGAGAIQLRTAGPGLPCKVWVWYPGSDAAGLAVFEAWFWKESARYIRNNPDIPELEEERSALGGTADAAVLTTALVLFALFFTCVYLLPSWTCEERERGLLLAQALTPASPGEMVAARALFYAALGIGLAVLVAAVGRPAALARVSFWAALAVAALGAVGIGLTIASLARTQRLASLGALAYTLTAALLLWGCRAGGVPGLSWLALEYHGPRLLHAALDGGVEVQSGGHLAAAAALASAWVTAAVALFRRRGWQ